MDASTRRARALMVWGTSSWAGKRVLATALCAALGRRGVRVAPFKAQNMSNNARVADGGEIGAAQYFQALAMGLVPSVAHNPVLLKRPRRALLGVAPGRSLADVLAGLAEAHLDLDALLARIGSVAAR